jgi:hypothetical protein
MDIRLGERIDHDHLIKLLDHSKICLNEHVHLNV